MSRTKPRQAPIGVEPLEGRQLMAIFMKVDGIDCIVQPPAEVQEIGTQREPGGDQSNGIIAILIG